VIEALIISISSDVSVESVGSFFPRVILIGSIYVEVSVAPEVGTAAVASLARVLEVDTYSSSEADPLERSPPPVSVAPMVLPFLCLDDSESDTEILERHVSPTPHDAMLSRWKRKITLRSSSPTTSIPEIPTAPILPAPSAIIAPSSEFTLAPVVAPPRIPLRYTSHHLDDFTSRSSSSHSSSDHSSSGHSSSGHSLSGHTPPDTTDDDSYTPSRFVHPPHAKTLWCSGAYLRWRSVPLSTMYPPMTSELSAGDSSFESSAGPSHKRCRSPAATVTSSTHATRALVPSRADLLPPRKSFRDSSSPEDSVEENIDTEVLEDIEDDAMAVEVTVDRDVEDGVDIGIDMEIDVEDEVKDEVESSDRGTMEVGVDVVVGIDILDGMLMPDAVECLEQVKEGLQDIYEHVMEIPLQRIHDIEMGQRELEARSMISSGERASLLDQVTSLERSNARLRGTMVMERARDDMFRRRVRFMDSGLGRFNMTITRSGMTPVEQALTAYEATRAANALEAENQSQNDSDDDNGNGGDGTGGNKNGGNGNPSVNNRDARPVVRELTRWFEKMETVFHISNCPEKYQVKYATCTLLDNALTWWKSHKRTVGTDAAFAMTWRELMKLMAEVYCPRNEIQKMSKEEYAKHLKLILELFKKEELYAKFLKCFSKIAKPIMKLTHKNVKFDWSEKAQAAFQLLKKKLCSAPILALPEGSEKGLGAVLMQMEKVIAYASCQLKIHEKNYTTHDLELRAVVFVLKMWRHYLYDTKCIVFTDHKRLQHILDQKDLKMRQRRWLELLSDYDSEIRYHPGKANVVADALSRKEQNKPLREADSMEKLTRQYLKEVVLRHGVPVLIISDRDTYHPQTDGQSERTNQTLEDMLRACVIDFRKGWDRHLPLVEFSYNNSYHTSIKAALFEALYSRKCQSPVCWAEVGDNQLTSPKIIHETNKKVVQMKSRIQAACDRQKSYADKRRKAKPSLYRTFQDPFQGGNGDLGTSLRVPAYLDNWNMTLLQKLDLVVHDLNGFFDEMELAVDLDLIQRNNECFIRYTFFYILSIECTMHSTQLFREFKKVSNRSHLGKDLESLDATFHLDDLLVCLMYDFWTCELAVSNLSPANRRLTLTAIQCLEQCCLDASMIAVVVQKLHQG
nr:reverse transcriptase domain-containing protein [Tanacetum cinerariifolium]